MANIFEQLMAQNREASETPKKAVKVESRKIPVTKIKLESRKIFEEEDLDVIDDKFSVDIDNVEDPENDEVVLVIDPELPAEGEEEPEVAAEEMIGDAVYKCPVCGANYLCDCDHLEEEGIEIGEDGAPVTCPICGDDADQILVGEIAPAGEVEEEDEVELDPVEPEDPEAEAEEDEGDEDEEVEVDEEEEEEEVEEESLKRPVRGRRMREDANINNKTGKDQYGQSMSDYQNMVDSDMKKNKSVSPNTKNALEKGGYELVKSDKAPYGYKVVAKDKRAAAEKETKTESRRPMVRRPAPRRPVANRTARTESYEIDNIRFERLMNKFLSENYKGNRKCTLKDAYVKNHNLTLEYVIAGGKNPVRGKLVSRNFNAKNASKMRFEDATRTFSDRNGYSFMIENVCRRNTIVPVGISYDFKKKVNESVYRVKGRHSLVESKK